MECDFSERYPGAIMFSQQKVMTDSDDDDPSQKAWRGGTSIWLLRGPVIAPRPFSGFQKRSQRPPMVRQWFAPIKPLTAIS